MPYKSLLYEAAWIETMPYKDLNIELNNSVIDGGCQRGQIRGRSHCFRNLQTALTGGPTVSICWPSASTQTAFEGEHSPEYFKASTTTDKKG